MLREGQSSELYDVLSLVGKGWNARATCCWPKERGFPERMGRVGRRPAWRQQRGLLVISASSAQLRQILLARCEIFDSKNSSVFFFCS